MLTVNELEEAEALQTIVVPLIVPTIDEVLNSKDLDLSKSDLNACYSKSQTNGKKRSWYDVQLTVNSKDYLPSREEWFYMATDSGYVFKACFVGKRIKRLSTFEDRKIIGMWIKNRLVAWEALKKFEFAHQDKKRIGIVTKEALKFYGGDKIFIKKTSKTLEDNDGIKRDVWFIYFPYKYYSEINSYFKS